METKEYNEYVRRWDKYWKGRRERILSEEEYIMEEKEYLLPELDKRYGRFDI